MTAEPTKQSRLRRSTPLLNKLAEVYTASSVCSLRCMLVYHWQAVLEHPKPAPIMLWCGGRCTSETGINDRQQPDSVWKGLTLPRTLYMVAERTQSPYPEPQQLIAWLLNGTVASRQLRSAQRSLPRPPVSQHVQSIPWPTWQQTNMDHDLDHRVPGLFHGGLQQCCPRRIIVLGLLRSHVPSN
jgi:hypothetical protein